MQNKSWTVLGVLDWGTIYFNQKGVRNPRFSIEWLLSHVLKVKLLDWIDDKLLLLLLLLLLL